MYACWNGHIDVVNLLLKQPNGVIDITASGFMVACYGGHVGVVQQLLELSKGMIDFDKKVGGRTGYGLAKDRGHTAVVELLEKAGHTS